MNGISSTTKTSENALKWPLVRLAEVCHKITDGTHRSPPNGAVGVPYITAKNIRRFGIDLNELTFVSPTHHREIYSRCDPRPGDVLYIKDGATMGIAAVNRLDFEFSMLSSVALIRPQPSLLNADFLAAWLNHPDTYRGVIEAQTGCAIQRMVLNDIRNIRVPLPPLPEQERIATELTSAIAAAEKARRAAQERLAAAEALPGAYYRQAFGDVAPFGATPLTLTAPVRPGWAWHRLTDLARLATGHTPSRRCPEYWNGDIPWIQLPDIRALDGKRAVDTSEHTNPLGIENSAAVLLPWDTVCLSRTASVGFVTIMDRPMATSQDFVNWVCGPDLDPEFLMHLFIRARQPIRELGSGAVHHTIYFPTVERFNVCVPGIDEQRGIVRFLAERLAGAERVRAAAAGQLAAIGALPAALLRQAFNGEIG